MYTALIHASRQLGQPLLPVQAMLAHVAGAQSVADASASSAQPFLALYIASCLAQQTFPRYTPGATPGGKIEASAAAPGSADAEAVQMAVLALLLWTDVAFCARFAGCATAPALHVRTYPAHLAASHACRLIERASSTALSLPRTCTNVCCVPNADSFRRLPDVC